MKKLKKFTNYYIAFVIEMLILGILLLTAAIYAGMKQSVDYLLGMLVFYVCFAAIAWVLIIVYGIVIFSSYKKAKERLRSIPGFQEERFEREVERAPKIQNIVICSDALCFRGAGGTIKVVPIQDIVWAYENARGKREALHIWTKEKKFYGIDISIKKKFGSREAGCRYLLRLIARKNKGTIIGYDQEYEQMIKRDFNRMLAKIQGKEIIGSAVLEQEYIENNYYMKDFC